MLKRIATILTCLVACGCSGIKATHQVSPDLKQNYSDKRIGYFVEDPSFKADGPGVPIEEYEVNQYFNKTKIIKVKASYAEIRNVTMGKPLFDYVNNYFESELNIPIDKDEATRILKANNIDCFFIMNTGVDYSDYSTGMSQAAKNSLINLGFIFSGLGSGLTSNASSGYVKSPYYRNLTIYTCGDKPLYQGFSRAKAKWGMFGRLAEELHKYVEKTVKE